MMQEGVTRLAASMGLAALVGGGVVALWRVCRNSPTSNHHAIVSSKYARNPTVRFDAFFSHDWGRDQHGRDNHKRVLRMRQRLQDLRGLLLWFDEEFMQGDIDEAMCNGIECSEVFVMFLTERYMRKVTGNDLQDNCKKEFNYAKQKIGAAKMICVVMEKRCLDTKTWPGQISMYCGSRLYFDFSSDEDFDGKIDRLADFISVTCGENSARNTNPITSDASSEAPEHFIETIHSLQEQEDVQHIIAGMIRFDSHAVVQQEGCAALQEIAHTTDRQARIASMGGISTVLNAMRAHTGHAGVQESGCGALCDIGVAAENKGMIAESGGVELVLEALRGHTGHAGVQKQGLSAMRILAVDGQIALTLVSAGAIEAAMEAMRLHPENAKVQQRACRALLQIGLSESGVQLQMKRAGVESLVEEAVRAKNATIKCKEKGQELLAKLKDCSGDPFILPGKLLDIR